MKRNLIVSLAFVCLLSACASTTPTREIQSAYAIYDVKVPESVTSTQLVDAVVTAVKKNVSEAHVNRNIPPHPLPAEPGRFELTNPFEGTNLQALAGYSPTVANCKDSLATIRAGSNGMQKYGETTSFFVCIIPYTEGYHIDIYTQFTKESGAFSVESLGATLARAVVGDSSQFIPRTIGQIVDSVKATGSDVTLVEVYPE